MKDLITNLMIVVCLLISGISSAYPHISPYAYTNCNPVNCVDPDGRRPIYSTFGYLLGTDDNGLQGDAIIMDSQFFHQGMHPKDALKYDLGITALVDPDAESRFYESYNNLNTRPDWDGYLTLEEANNWYRHGNGQPLFVSLEKIDLSGLVSLGDNYVGDDKIINLFRGSYSINDALVYGHIRLVRYPNDTVRSYSDYYDFDIKPWNSASSAVRNIQTIIGNRVAGQGVGYEINIYGSKRLRTVPQPW